MTSRDHGVTPIMTIENILTRVADKLATLSSINTGKFHFYMF